MLNLTSFKSLSTFIQIFYMLISHRILRNLLCQHTPIVHRNKFYFSKRLKTIYALSSGSLPSAIAVVRLSGDKSEDALRILTRRPDFEPMKIFYSKFFDHEGEVIDQAMACFMKGPKTFTGEDCAELYLHGSRAIVNAVFVALAKIPGLESARAGEFSKKAFYNGKMDVLQVEALSGLISAETDSQRTLALRQARSSKYLRDLRTQILHLSARLEASIDFGEELAAGAIIQDDELQREADLIRKRLRELHRGALRGSLIRSGVHVALVGRTNVGKSSLMNRLAEKDVAIVSDVPGTTRDSLQLRLQLNSMVVNFTDTAGIRETDDILELEGIRRSVQRAEEANVVVLVLDKHKHDTARNEVRFLLKRINFNPVLQRLIVCINKSDLLTTDSFESIQDSAMEAECADKLPPLNVVWASCREENGLEELVKQLENLINGEYAHNNLLTEDASDGNNLVLSGNRHTELLERALVQMERFAEAFVDLNDVALAAQNLRECAAAVGEISGAIVNHEVMERIFSTMCVGK